MSLYFRTCLPALTCADLAHHLLDRAAAGRARGAQHLGQLVQAVVAFQLAHDGAGALLAIGGKDPLVDGVVDNRQRRPVAAGG